MTVIYTKYGTFIEITRCEKTPNSPKVRVHRSKNRNRPVGPRRPDNIRRTQKICVRRVSSALEEFGCPLLVTLTFKGDSSDASLANDSLRRFQVRLRDKFPLAESIFIPELSPRGRIHFHGLLFNVPLHLGDTRKGRRIISYGTERETRELAGLWGHGYVDATQTDGSPRLAFYISKYITKGAGQVIFNAMRLLRCSRGIPKEIVIRGALAEKLEEQYAKTKPIKEWEGVRPFVGKVTKKTYQQDGKGILPILPKVD